MPNISYLDTVMMTL